MIPSTKLLFRCIQNSDFAVLLCLYLEARWSRMGIETVFGDNILKIIFGPEAIQSVNVLRVLLIAIFI